MNNALDEIACERNWNVVQNAYKFHGDKCPPILEYFDGVPLFGKASEELSRLRAIETAAEKMASRIQERLYYHPDLSDAEALSDYVLASEM